MNELRELLTRANELANAIVAEANAAADKNFDAANAAFGIDEQTYRASIDSYTEAATRAARVQNLNLDSAIENIKNL